MLTAFEHRGTPADLQRIAFVTRRFADLQGLRAVSYGAVLLVGAWINSLLPLDTSPMFGVVMVASLFGSAARLPLDRYYGRTFGTLAVRPGTVQAGILPIELDLVVTALTFDVILLQIFDLRIGLGGVLLIGFCLRTVIRDWPLRMHHAIGAASGMAAVIVLALAPPKRAEKFTLLLEPAVGEFFAVSCALIGLALVVTGLLDHRVLVQAMWRPSSRQAVERLPPQRFAVTRIVLAGTVAPTGLMHLMARSWPSHDSIMMGMFLTSLILLLVAGVSDNLSAGMRMLTYGKREREAERLARIEGREPQRLETAPMTEIPPPDVWGHVVLPVAIACGALADVLLRATGLPSFLALALAASHLRIAIRDWPDRKHYLLGAAAACVGAVQHVFIPHVSRLDWALSFLMLVSIAMLIEGFLDRRLESHPRGQFSDDRHANTI